MACRDCKLLRVLPDADGKVRLRKDRVYQCRAKVHIVPLPRSARGWQWKHYMQTPSLSRMSPDDGDNCFYHEAKK